MGNKATKAESRRRVNQIQKLITNGLSRADILQYCTEKLGWTIAERQIDAYIQKANELFRQLGKAQIDENRGLALARYNDIFAKTMKVQDFQRAIAAQRAICDLLGLNAPAVSVQTLKVLGVDMSTISQIAEQASAAGLQPAELFNALLAEIARAKVEAEVKP